VRFAGLVVLVVACSHAQPPVPMRPLSREAYSHYLAGRFAMYGEDYAKAVSELAAAAAAAPDQPSIAIEEARALAKAKRGAEARGAEARTVLANARVTWPEHSQVWLASGELLEKEVPDEAAHA